MAITKEGKKSLNFFSGNGSNDLLYGGDALFHFGSGQVDKVTSTLGNELFTVPATLKQVSKVSSADGSIVSDVSVLVCDITTSIGSSEITEVGISVDGVMAALDTLNLTDEEQFTLTKKETGSTHVEWAFIRTRPNEAKLIHAGEDFTLWMNPLVSNTGINQGLFNRIQEVVIRKDANSTLEKFTAAGSYSLIIDTNGDLVISIDMSLMPVTALQGAYPYATLSEVHIGAVNVDEPGLFSVYWDTVKTRTSEQSFKVRFSKIIRVEVS